MPVLPTGIQQVQTAIANQQSGFARQSGRLNFGSWEDGEIKYLRFIDESIITCKFYEWILNNKGERTEFICAPDLYRLDPDWKGEDWVQSWIDKNQAVGSPIGWQLPYKSTTPVVPKLANKAVGIAVVMERIEGTQPPQFRDKIENEEIDGVVYPTREFILLKNGLRNFWDQFIGYQGLYGSLCDRVYHVQRKGGDKTTTYQAIGMGEDRDWVNDGSSLKLLQEYYGYGVKLDEDDSQNPEGMPWSDRYMYCSTTIEDWVVRRASQERADYWLNPNADHLDDKAKGKGTVTAASLLNTGAQGSMPADQQTNGVGSFNPTTTPAPSAQDTTAPAPPAPAAVDHTDRFEQMRANMEAKKKAAAEKAKAATSS